MLKIKLALKYAFSRNGGQRANAILIMLGIAASIVAVLVIISVMNGLQNSQLEKMRNAASFDIIVETDNLNSAELSSIDGVCSVVLFYETNVLISDKTNGNSTVCKVRCIDYEDIKSSRISNSIKIQTSETEFNKGVTLSYSIRSSISYKKGDELQFTFLKPGKSATVVPYNASLEVVGYYQCSYSDFSSTTILMSNSIASEILENTITTYGLFVDSNVKAVKNKIIEMDCNSEITVWQEYNKSFYSALMLEKAMMYLFLGFMFLILCVNLKNSTDRLLLRKQGEGAMLRAIGANRKFVNSIFVYQGLFVTIFGESIGLILSKLIIKNMQDIIDFLGNVIFDSTGIISYLGSGYLSVSISDKEIIFVLLGVFALSFVFVLSGCRKVFKKEILEVLLNESY